MSKVKSIVKIKNGYKVSFMDQENNLFVPEDPGYVLMSGGWEHVDNINTGDSLWDIKVDGEFPDFPEFKETD